MGSELRSLQGNSLQQILILDLRRRTKNRCNHHSIHRTFQSINQKLKLALNFRAKHLHKVIYSNQLKNHAVNNCNKSMSMPERCVDEKKIISFIDMNENSAGFIGFFK